MRRKEEILEAVVKDYGMSKNEAELFEFYPVLTEIENTLANFQCWSQEKVDLASDDFGNSSRFFYSNKFKISLPDNLGDAPLSKALLTASKMAAL